MDLVERHIEALIFCALQPITVEELMACIEEVYETQVSEADINNAIEQLKTKFDLEESSIELSHSGGGFQFLSKPAYQNVISVLIKQKSKKRLSTSALETLSIIAYKQPVSKGEVEAIRGVSCDYAVHKLLDKELIEIKGKSESIGRPVLYGTSHKFMDYFGINSLKDLPQPKDFEKIEIEIGENEETKTAG